MPEPLDRSWAETEDEARQPKGSDTSHLPAEPHRGCAGCLAIVLVLGGIAVGLGLFVAWQNSQAAFYGEAKSQLLAILLPRVCVPLGIVLGLVWLAYFRPEEQAIVKVGSVCLCYAAVMGALIWAPWVQTSPTTYVTPEIVGIVESTGYAPGGAYSIFLEGGRVLAVEDVTLQSGQTQSPGRYKSLAGNSIDAGDFLLAGDHPTSWYATLVELDPSSSRTAADRREWCMSSIRGVIRHDTVDLDIGLRLKRADDAFLYRHEGGFEGMACVNKWGEVTDIITFDY